MEMDTAPIIMGSILMGTLQTISAAMGTIIITVSNVSEAEENLQSSSKRIFGYLNLSR